MKRLLRPSAAFGFFVGLMSMIAGSLVLTGIKDAGYITLTWLLVYNIALGALSIVVATTMWRAKRGNRGVFLIAASHLGVLGFVGSLWLQDSAALQSLQAMVFRSVVWVTLSLIVHFHLRSLEASACFEVVSPTVKTTPQPIKR